MIQERYSLNSGPSQTYTYTYDDCDRLKTKTLPGNITITYAYNLRGWVEKIHSSLFTETLYYTTSPSPTGKKYFNGNISAQTWVNPVDAPGITKGYSFQYDGLDRFVKGFYGEGSTLSSNPNLYEESLTYDDNGNVMTLRRNGLKDNGTYSAVDILTMTYNGNRLTRVTDAGGNQNNSGIMEFKGSTYTGNHYTYNMSKPVNDVNRGICLISYNYLVLPNSVQFSYGHRTEYLYDASGKKLSMKHLESKRNLNLGYYSTEELTTKDTLRTTKTDYVGNKVYEEGKLKRILTNSGYVEVNGKEYTHLYYQRDHLGNNRVLADASGRMYAGENYYPSGTTMMRSANNMPYKFNGKELNRTFGQDQYDYEARMYDPTIMRFTTQDPLREKYYAISPYAYCANNPLKYIDPEGKWIVGLDGNPVVYSPIGWSQNASEDVRRVGDALAMTETGRERLSSMLFHSEKISITISSEINKTGNEFKMGTDKKTGIKEFADGRIEIGEHEITIYEGSIRESIKENSGVKQYSGLTMEEAIGAVAGHESGHIERENTKQGIENRDKKGNHDVEAGSNKIENAIIQELNTNKGGEMP